MDGWFIGFTNDVTVAVWVGYDNADRKRRSLGSSRPARVLRCRFSNQSSRRFGRAKLHPRQPSAAHRQRHSLNSSTCRLTTRAVIACVAAEGLWNTSDVDRTIKFTIRNTNSCLAIRPTMSAAPSTVKAVCGPLSPVRAIAGPGRAGIIPSKRKVGDRVPRVRLATILRLAATIIIGSSQSAAGTRVIFLATIIREVARRSLFPSRRSPAFRAPLHRAKL